MLTAGVRTFRAATMRQALELVKRELGPDAVILSTRTLPATGGGPGAPGLAGRPRVEITAGPPTMAGVPARSESRVVSPKSRGPSPTFRVPSPVLSGAEGTVPGAPQPGGVTHVGALPPDLYRQYVHLVQNEVAEGLATLLVQRAATRMHAAQADGWAALQAVIREFVVEMTERRCVPLRSDRASASRSALIGPPGSGKTTTLAKLAAHFKLRQGRSVTLLSLDMLRLAAHEQLRRYAEVIEVPFFAAQTVDEVKQCLSQLGPTDRLLIDTPGVGVRDQGRFARLAALLRAARPDETLLVLPASLAPAAQSRAARGFAPLRPTSLVLTRLDEAIGFGVILNVMQQLNMAVSYVTTGQNVPNDLEETCNGRLAELILAADA